ncbi:hypothetical protein SAMN05216218_109157 [Halorientalis regularis]|uniref:Uncharacterized protein n=1 Tax=Halorientalis regularis TaxID=660518 RepID=A0A1G7NV65_9EURY|nr:hypothetical protein SAMN05216218_109157 [Halorientalis regularis]
MGRALRVESVSARKRHRRDATPLQQPHHNHQRSQPGEKLYASPTVLVCDTFGAGNDPDGFARDLDESGLGTEARAAIGSVGWPLYCYSVHDDKRGTQFVGLWPAPRRWLAIYFELDDIGGMLGRIED